MEALYNNKNYKYVNLQGSPSYLSNNLSGSGEHFCYVSNAEPYQKVHIFDKV